MARVVGGGGPGAGYRRYPAYEASRRNRRRAEDACPANGGGAGHRRSIKEVTQGFAKEGEGAKILLKS